MKIEIRDYQEQAVSNILADWRTGVKSVLIQAATGTGKTVIFLRLIERILAENPKARILVIAHRRELIYQPIERAEQHFPDVARRMGIVMADQDSVGSQIIVATIQSLVSGTRLARILEAGAIEYVIIDEAHHAPADTYRQVLEAIGEHRLVGFTATPKRTDGLAMDEIFKKVSFRVNIEEAIAQQMLVPFTPLGFSLPVDQGLVENLRETEEGWDDEPLGDLLSAENILEIVYSKWVEFASNRPTIAFTASVAQAHATAKFFSQNDISAEALDANTPKKVRAQMLERYKSGVTKVLFNCMVLTEGFDAPETRCVMMIAPTKSDLVYVQRLGRGLRIVPGKEDCLVLDFAPMGMRDLVMADNVLDGAPKREVVSIEKAEEEGILFGGWKVTAQGILPIDPHEITVQVLDYLTKHRLSWGFEDGVASAALNKDAMIAIVPPSIERMEKAMAKRTEPGATWTDAMERLAGWIASYRVYMIEKQTGEEGRPWWQARLIGSFNTMSSAKNTAEQMTKSVQVDMKIAGKKSEWRKNARPMTDPQARYLKTLRAWQPGLTSDQAARRITHALAMRSIANAEKEIEPMIMRGA